MKIYHGTTTNQAHTTFSGDFSGRFGWDCLYVTDTPERAARYANAQATLNVDPDATTVGAHAVVLILESDESIVWQRRPDSHQTLDVCEATIRHGRIVGALIGECDYWNCTCHANAQRIREAIAQA